jgi:hypothetical protein
VALDDLHVAQLYGCGLVFAPLGSSRNQTVARRGGPP